MLDECNDASVPTWEDSLLHWSKTIHLKSLLVIGAGETVGYDSPIRSGRLESQKSDAGSGTSRERLQRRSR
jgi:hypothetical protein